MLQNLEATDMLLKEFKELSSANSAGPQVKIEEIEKLFSLAVSMQAKIDQELEDEQAIKRGKKLTEIRGSLDENLGEITLERLIARAEEIGVSRQAMANAHHALSLRELRNNNVSELEGQFDLPAGAGVEWVKEEREIRAWVDSIRPKFRTILNDIASDPEAHPQGRVQIGSGLSLGAEGHCCRAELHPNSLRLLTLYSIPIFGQIMLSNAFMDSGHSGLFQANLNKLHSPSLNRLRDEVQQAGGDLQIELSYWNRFASDNPIAVNIYLTLPTSRELKN